MTKKKKVKGAVNKNKIFYITMASLAAIIIISSGVKVCFDFFISDEKPVVSKKTLDNLELYGYTLDDLDTELYKTYFNELKDILNEEEVNMVSYAEVLTKLFITDFYSLSNKVTSSDIGGTEFIHPDMVDNFKMHAGDTMYNHVKNNVYGDRTQELPTVKSVTIDNIREETYSYNNNEYEAFRVVASWSYEKDLGYESNGTFYLIRDNNKLNIVEKPEE